MTEPPRDDHRDLDAGSHWEQQWHLLQDGSAAVRMRPGRGGTLWGSTRLGWSTGWEGGWQHPEGLCCPHSGMQMKGTQWDRARGLNAESASVW